jgi:hypothetical protein
LKPSIVLTAALSLVAVLLVSASGAQSQTDNRAYVTKVTAKTTPARDRTSPYTFRTVGRVAAPSKPCPPGTHPTKGKNCVPITCPPGNPDPLYCQQLAKRAVCTGKVNVRIQKRTTTISSRNVKVRSDCTYRSTVRMRTLLPTRRGLLRVRARFQGNAVLRPKASATRSVRAG